MEQSGIQKEEQAIRHLMTQLVAAFNAGAVDKAVSLHTENVVLIESGMPDIQGNKALKELFTGYFAAMKSEGVSPQLDLTIIELEVAGSRAFVRGEVGLTKIKAGVNPVRKKGRFLSLFQQVDGLWLRSHIASVSDPD